MCPDLQSLGIEDREPVDEVGAELHVNVLRQVLALVKPVGGPIGEV